MTHSISWGQLDENIATYKLDNMLAFKDSILSEKIFYDPGKAIRIGFPLFIINQTNSVLYDMKYPFMPLQKHTETSGTGLHKFRELHYWLS